MGGIDPLGRGRPPTQTLFGENVCENERIGPCRGCAPGTPPRSTNVKDTYCTPCSFETTQFDHGDTKHKIVVLMQKYPTFVKYVG